MHHNLKERKKRTEKKERRITHYKIDNNLNGLEKYSLIFGEQPQQLRKINVYMYMYMYMYILHLHKPTQLGCLVHNILRVQVLLEAALVSL